MKRSLCLAVFYAVSGFAFASASVKSDLEARYREVTAAFKAKNINAMGSMLMPNYKAVAQDGRSIGRDQILAQFKQQMTMISDLTWTRKITALSVKGSTATATVAGDFKGHMAGRGPKTLELIATTVDDWVKTPGGWKLATSHLKSSKMLMDGKPMNVGR